jgi:hypothetical protein
MAAGLVLYRDALQQPIEAARALPELEATMASLVRRIA